MCMDNERLREVGGVRVAGFDWDQGNLGKCAKHGVSIAEIEWLFARTPRVAPDLGHSLTENRFIAVGRNPAGRPLFVAFTFRKFEAGIFIRPVSARYMHAKEIANYEKSGAEAEDGRGG